MRAFWIGAVLLAASGCRTAPTAAPAKPVAAAVRTHRYYLLKFPATVGWVSDQPFRYVSYDDKSQADLFAGSPPSSFEDLAQRAKKKGYRLVATKRNP